MVPSASQYVTYRYYLLAPFDFRGVISLIRGARKWSEINFSRRKGIDIIVAMVGFIVMTVAESARANALILSIAVLLESFYLVFVVRRNRLFLLVYGIIAYACYSICVANYLHPVAGTMFTSLSGTQEAFTAMRILLLFLCCMVTFLPSYISKYGKKANPFCRKESNPLLVIVLAIILALVCIYSFGRPDSLGSDRGSPSTFYEYSTILFIIAFHLAGRKRWLNGLLLTVLAAYVLQNLMYGGRVTALQLLFIAFFFFISEKMSLQAFIVTCVALAIFFLGFGDVRTSIYDVGLRGVWQAFVSMLQGGLAWDTAYSSWHTSITFVLYDQIISVSQHIYLLKQWILSIILGGSAVQDAHLANLTRAYWAHWYGGVLPVYVWFYLKEFGVVLFAAFVSLLMKSLSSLTDGYRATDIWSTTLRLSLLYVVITVPRWFLYSPSQITRGFLLCLVFCAFLLWIDRNMSISASAHEQTIIRR